MSETIHHQIVIIGGGTAGITVAAQLTRNWFHRRGVALIEPSDKHYYQPLWTLVGAGLAKKEATERTEASVKDTLRHQHFANVFTLGDCSNLPTSKTGAAIRKQAPVVVRNLLAAMQGQPLPAKYDGYTSCPLITGIGKLKGRM